MGDSTHGWVIPHAPSGSGGLLDARIPTNRARGRRYVRTRERTNGRLFTAAMLIAALAPVGAGAEEPAAAPAVAAVEDDAPFVDAWLVASERYRMRAATGPDLFATDQDARLLLDGRATIWKPQLSLSTSAALFWDTDGPDTTGGLYSVRDTDSGLWLGVYSLEARWEGDGWLRKVQVGRFGVDAGLFPVTVDGAGITVAPLAHLGRSALLGLARSELFIQGGRTVHFFEIDGDHFEDWLGQVGADLYLLDSLKLRLDYRAAIEDTASDNLDHLYGARLSYRAGAWLLTDAYARGLDDRLARVGGRGHLTAPDWNIGADGFVDWQPTTLGQLNERYNPFFTVLGESRPHVRFGLEVWQRQDLTFIDLGLRLGWNGRLMLEDEGPFNRSYARTYAGLDAQDILLPGLYVDTSLEYHYASTFTDDGLLTVGGEAGYRTRWLRAALGSSYQRFKYVYYRDVNELADVRTFFTSLAVRVYGPLNVRADYSLDVYDRTVHTLMVTFGQNVDFAL